MVLTLESENTKGGGNLQVSAFAFSSLDERMELRLHNDGESASGHMAVEAFLLLQTAEVSAST